MQFEKPVREKTENSSSSVDDMQIDSEDDQAQHQHVQNIEMNSQLGPDEKHSESHDIH